jgi:hypothetical protein
MHLLAYIDPGSGSLAIQAVIATAMVVPFVLRSQIKRGVSRLRGHSPVAPPATTTAPDSTTQPPDDVPPAHS